VVERPVSDQTTGAVAKKQQLSLTPSLGATTGKSEPASAAAAMQQDESGRMRAFAGVVVAIGVSVFFAVPFIGGDPTAGKIHMAGAVVGGIGALWSYLRLRAGHPYTSFQNTTFGLAGIFAVSTGYFYWGPLSAVLLLLPFGAFIFSTHRSLASALIVCGVAYTTHFVVSMLMIYGVIADNSIIQPVAVGRTSQTIILVIVQGINIAAFIVARGAHKSTHDAVEQLRRAVRALSLRDQLLSEAKDELARALMIGGAGKYTGAQLGNYKLGEVLGRGAMGEVYDAVHAKDESVAAVKVLHPEVLASPQHVLRFLRELEMIATIESPHVVRVLEVASLDNGLPYLAMERLNGVVLSQHLQERGRLKVDEVVAMIRQVGRGLQAAHAQGILHRDIKPQNIFLTDEGNWTVLDFGVAKLLDAEATMTQGRVVGTPAYMSPEQARGEELDRESDLYSLAVVAYRALVGRSPVSGGKAAEVLGRVATGKPRRPRGLGEHSVDVEAVFAIAMAKRPADRFPDGETFAAALSKAGTGNLNDKLRRRSIGLDTFDN